METKELLKKVRKIEIRTRGLSQHLFSGEYHSAFKGRGMSFSEVREYQYGDDIRNIDWNVTARFNHPYVKIFEEERELTVMLMIDASASNSFGTKLQFKRELISEIAAILSFSAIQNNDKVGAIFFSDKVEKFIPPQKGSSHILLIIRELLNFEPTRKSTSLSEAFRFLTNAIKKRCTSFIFSDFIDTNFEEALKIASRKHDTIAVCVRDPKELTLPQSGLFKLVDAETNMEQWMDASDPSLRLHYKKWWEENNRKLEEVFTKAGVDMVRIYTGEDYIKPLKNLFLKRGRN